MTHHFALHKNLKGELVLIRRQQEMPIDWIPKQVPARDKNKLVILVPFSLICGSSASGQMSHGMLCAEVGKLEEAREDGQVSPLCLG